jgi:hypothetical protein
MLFARRISAVPMVFLPLLPMVVGSAFAQGTTPPVTPPAQHQHATPSTSSWHVMQDAVAFFIYNNQGGPRGGEDAGSQNWWMGMAQRPAGSGTLQFNLMLSLDPWTIGNDGYREIFQAGETLNNLPLIDRQHPHDFLMQAAVVWRTPIGGGYRLTLAGAPVGEPALGPVAFMHRASAAENPTAPLGHHTFDATHIAMGVLTAGVDRGPWTIESSIFRGREPDEQRWDLMDPGPLDSWSVRGWFRPNDQWTFQLSHGFLNEPEPLEPGDVRRTTLSAAWSRSHASGTTATTVLLGRNDKESAGYTAFLAESTHTFGKNALYGRLEALQVETDLLRFGTHTQGGHTHGDEGESGGFANLVSALTLGGTRTISRWSGWDFGAGADVTFYAVPEILKPTHGNEPVSFHVFVRVRPPAPMGRMVDMIMTKGMH